MPELDFVDKLLSHVEKWLISICTTHMFGPNTELHTGKFLKQFSLRRGLLNKFNSLSFYFFQYFLIVVTIFIIIYTLFIIL